MPNGSPLLHTDGTCVVCTKRPRGEGPLALEVPRRPNADRVLTLTVHVAMPPTPFSEQQEDASWLTHQGLPSPMLLLSSSL